MEKLIVSVSFCTHTLFRWKGKSCPDNEASSCCLGHGDILVMDGQCQHEFVHCTVPGLDQERINVTFCWIQQHTASCPLRTGLVCCLPPCAQGSSAAVTRVVGYGAFWAFWVLLGVLCTCEVLALLVFPLMSTRLGLRGCAHRWTRPLGGGRWGHHLRDSRGVHWLAQRCPSCFQVIGSDSIVVMLYMLALAGLPSLHGYCACMV